MQELEESGLRKDIYLYQTENYEKEYSIEQFLPSRASSTIDLGVLDDDFEELATSGTKELTNEQKLLNKKRKEERDNFIKTRPYTNQNGLFLFALSKAMKADSSFTGYCESKYFGFDFSPTLIAHGYLDSLTEAEYSEWKNKIPLVIDFYLFHLLVKYGGATGF